MTKTNTSQILSANDLLDGRVIYLAEGRTWNRSLDAALVMKPGAEAQHLLTHAEGQPNTVVGPYLINVTLQGSGTPRPFHLRDRIRAGGPFSGTEIQHIQETADVSL